MKSIHTVITIAWLLVSTSPAWSETTTSHSDVINDQALNALTEYWTHFDGYEKRVQQRKKLDYLQTWEEYKKVAEDKQKRLTAEQIQKLTSAAESYETHLKRYPAAPDKAHVLANLAQIYRILAGQERAHGSSERLTLLQKAIDSISEIEINHPSFAQLDTALYAKALALEESERPAEALAAWDRLAKRKSRSIYCMYANIALGDHHFNGETPAKALQYYRTALGITSAIDAERREYETLRVHYRMAWAGYRSANLEQAVQSAAEILAPGTQAERLAEQDSIRRDAIDIIGDSLFEDGNVDKTIRQLNDRRISSDVPAIGLRYMVRASSANQHSRVIKVGDHLVKRVPHAKELPEWLILIAKANDSMGKPRARLAALERLALLLPAESLWRAKHRQDFEALDAMQFKALDAARLAAAAHYDRGLATGAAPNFAAASTFYDLMVRHDPNHRDSHTWRLRLAHCRYFSGKFQVAAKMYEDLRTNYKLDEASLEIASFQLVMARHRGWQEAYATKLNRESSPRIESDSDPVALQRLHELEKSVESYADRYPQRERAIDLLLLAGAANRDHSRHGQAEAYWQRSLMLPGNSGQRVAAIQGLVFSKMKSGSPALLVETAQRYLRLENWGQMPATLKSELQGVLAQAARTEAERLEAAGEVAAAGQLLVEVGQEHPDLPNRSAMIRDGAYLLAMSGDWHRAQAATESYLATGMRDHAGDMIYLLARGSENQIRFREASQNYLRLAKEYPAHPKVVPSLERAEALATAEGDLVAAGDAATAQGDLGKRVTDKHNHYTRAMNHYRAAGRVDSVAAVGKRLSGREHEIGSQLEARIKVARAKFESGQESAALDEFRTVSMAADAAKARLGARYNDIAGESLYWQGHDNHSAFQEFNIEERRGTPEAKLAEKLNLFEKLSRLYASVISSNSPEWSARARYQLARAAEEMAESITMTMTRHPDRFRQSSRQQYTASAERLQRLARRNHGDNIMARNRFPNQYRSNVWVMKSSVELNAVDASGLALSDDSALPAAVEVDLPQQWSL